jgi:hypothetical protein
MSEKISLKELKEQAFRGPAAPPPVGAYQPQPGDSLEWTPPVATVPLPSRGKVYPPESPLFDVQSLDVRAMTAADENIMTSPALIRRGRMLSALIKACITNRSVSPDDMLVGDKNALMVAIRNASYGPGYLAGVSCPECDKEHEAHFDLSKLSLKTLDEDPIEMGSNLFSFQLPVTKKVVRFRLHTGASEAELSQVLQAQAKAAGPGAVEQNVTQEILSHIVSIDNVDDRTKIARFVQSMPVLDARKFMAHVKAITPDVEMRQVAECPACGEKSEVTIPLGMEFFWPSVGTRDS